MKITRHFANYLTAACAATAVFASYPERGWAQAKTLFEGETIVEAAGFPSVTRFLPGEKSAPLVVFIPGANHMARIAYGGHNGADAKDFLAYWLNSQGYNFLGISYPLDTDSDVYLDNFPEYDVTDWGRQAMEIAQQTIIENELSGEVIVVGWSMAGKIPASVQIAAKELGVDLDGFVALSGTAAVPGLLSYDRLFDKLKSGYADRRRFWEGWHKQIKAMADNAAHEIVPYEIYIHDYVGDGPVGLEGFSQRYHDGEYIVDYAGTTDDNGAFKYSEYPLVGVIAPNGTADARHAVTDFAVWNFYNANTIYNRYVTKAVSSLEEFSQEKWQGILDLTKSAEDRLSLQVPGNHFFFVGQNGARTTAAAIDALYHKNLAMKEELGVLLGVDLRQF